MRGEMTEAYGEAWYWDKRYAKESTASSSFDWYQKYESLAPLLHLYVPPTTRIRILVVGAGNSGWYFSSPKLFQTSFPFYRMCDHRFSGTLHDNIMVDIMFFTINCFDQVFPLLNFNLILRTQSKTYPNLEKVFTLPS
ncbi:hypothetical protein HanPI659440_Chr13g0487741 [Helianthus annuus]|nr:hypothetical protein HanPI659440_Chr13g0487741 [Helianthus annuus]